MILDQTPSLKQLLIEIWKPLAVLFVWDVVVTVTWYLTPYTLPALPVTLFGTALGLFLGFRSNSAYQRWWEGRVLWGAMINASRSLARATLAFLPDDEADARVAKRAIVLRQIAYVHALRRQLRRQDPHEVIVRWLPADEAASLRDRRNPANALLDGTAERLARARAAGWIDSIQQAQLESVLVDIANAQGGMERLKNTPLPNQYRFPPTLFTRIFCILLPFALVETLEWATPIGSTLAGLMFLALLRIGDDLVDPFARTVHDVPLTAMCRTIEIDLLQAIGDRAPDPLQPERGVLW